jgi:hypothetical protein
METPLVRARAQCRRPPALGDASQVRHCDLNDIFIQAGPRRPAMWALQFNKNPRRRFRRRGSWRLLLIVSRHRPNASRTYPTTHLDES